MTCLHGCDHEAYDVDCDDYEVTQCCGTVIHVDDVYKDGVCDSCDADDYDDIDWLDDVAATLRAQQERRLHT